MASVWRPAKADSIVWATGSGPTAVLKFVPFVPRASRLFRPWVVTAFDYFGNLFIFICKHHVTYDER